MGGYFSHHIACNRPEQLSCGGASLGATMADLSSCPTKHVPIIIFHGLADTLIERGMQRSERFARTRLPCVCYVVAATKNGCQKSYKTIAMPGSTMGNNGNCYLYDGCPPDGQVELCTFANMPHAWAGATSCPGCIGSGAGYASATQLEWEFFEKYAW